MDENSVYSVDEALDAMGVGPVEEQPTLPAVNKNNLGELLKKHLGGSDDVGKTQ
jgi:hypothetical protein